MTRTTRITHRFPAVPRHRPLPARAADVHLSQYTPAGGPAWPPATQNNRTMGAAHLNQTTEAADA